MIETLLSSKTRMKLLMKFFLNSNNSSYLRNLEEEFGESTNGIRIELNRFEKAGFLESNMEGNKKMYKVNVDHPLFKDLNSILMKMTGLNHLIDYVLERIGDLECVYLVGKLARGQNSDIIDIVLVGENINVLFLIEQIEKAEVKTGKKIRYIRFSPNEFSVNKIEEPGMRPLLIWKK
jgi:hypothetical protein